MPKDKAFSPPDYTIQEFESAQISAYKTRSPNIRSDTKSLMEDALGEAEYKKYKKNKLRYIKELRDTERKRRDSLGPNGEETNTSIKAKKK